MSAPEPLTSSEPTKKPESSTSEVSLNKEVSSDKEKSKILGQCLTPSFEQSRAHASVQGKPADLNQNLLLKNQEGENRLDEKKLNEIRLSGEICEKIRKQTTLVRFMDTLESLYKANVNYVIEHLTFAIKENKPQIMMQLINCTPFPHAERIKEVDALFCSDKNSTLLQLAEASNSLGCRFLLMHHGADSANMYKDPNYGITRSKNLNRV